MSSWLHRLSNLLPDGIYSRSARDQINTSRPRPEVTLAVVGDIHGRADLLARLLAQLADQAPDAKLVFVGDYVDRGPESKSVIATLRSLPAAICLGGNHEVMLLEFLDAPIQRGGRWLRNGGGETLASYGISLNETSSQDAVLTARQEFSEILADGTETWLRALPLIWRSDNLLVTHAGPDPSAPIEGQDDKAFLWGHPRFLRDGRSDGMWVAHGHWIRESPNCADGRINVDTGAWKTGRLTAALIDPKGQVNFIQTRSS